MKDFVEVEVSTELSVDCLAILLKTVMGVAKLVDVRHFDETFQAQKTSANGSIFRGVPCDLRGIAAVAAE